MHARGFEKTRERERERRRDKDLLKASRRGEAEGVGDRNMREIS